MYKDSADRKRNRAETVVRATFYTLELITYLCNINVLLYSDKPKETFFFFKFNRNALSVFIN